jgi:hypothetical protein
MSPPAFRSDARLAYFYCGFASPRDDVAEQPDADLKIVLSLLFQLMAAP